MIATRSNRNKITVTRFITPSFYSAAMIATFTLLPIVAARLGGSDSTAGVPSTIALLGRAVAAYPIGWLMDRIGRRVGLSVGYGFGVAGLIVAAWAIFSGSFLWLLLGVGLYGMGRGASELTRYVAAEVQPREQQSRAIGWIVSAGTIGAIGGPLLVEPSGKMVEKFGFLELMGPFVFGAVLAGASLLLVWTLMRPDPSTFVVPEVKDSFQESGDKGSLWQLFSSANMLMALGSMVIGQLVMSLIMVITPLLMSNQEHSTKAISFVIMAHTLGMFGLAWLTGELVDRYGRAGIIIRGALLLLISAIMAQTSDTVPTLAIALFLLGLGWNFCFVAGSSLLIDSVTTENRGRAQGTAEVVVALSSGAGSLSAGALFALGGMSLVSSVALMAVLALLAGATWFIFSRRTPHSIPSRELT